MAKNKAIFDFGELSEQMERLDKLGGNLKEPIEKSLAEAHKIITDSVHANMQPHHITGDTEKSIEDTAVVKWEGAEASTDIGFNLDNGGIPSIFLMYGTPKMKKDTKLYNSIYGKETRRKITAIQRQAVYDAVQAALKGKA